MSINEEVFTLIKEVQENEEAEELYLDSLEIPTFTEELKTRIEKISTLSVLSLNSCGLTSLKNFPNLPNLVRLELISNSFPESDLVHLTHLKELQSLSIGGNQIKSFDEVKKLAVLENLLQLDLTDTPLANTEKYRDNVFEVFKELQILDNLDLEGNSVQYSDAEEGDFEDDGFAEEGESMGEDDEDEEDEYDADEDEEEYGEPIKKLKK